MLLQENILFPPRIELPGLYSEIPPFETLGISARPGSGLKGVRASDLWTSPNPFPGIYGFGSQPVFTIWVFALYKD